MAGSTTGFQKIGSVSKTIIHQADGSSQTYNPQGSMIGSTPIPSAVKASTTTGLSYSTSQPSVDVSGIIQAMQVQNQQALQYYQYQNTLQSTQATGASSLASPYTMNSIQQQNTNGMLNGNTNAHDTSVMNANNPNTGASIKSGMPGAIDRYMGGNPWGAKASEATKMY